MNERIQKLAEQSGLYDEKSPDEVPEFTACFEKFAELLIQECVYVLGENISPLQMKSFLDEYPERIPMSSKELQDRRRNGQIEGLLMGAKAIEEHFRVEK